MLPKVDSVKIIESGSQGWKTDLLAVEEPLEIRLGYGLKNNRDQTSLSVTMRTPGHDFELALGFLFTEGIIQKYAEVESIKYCEDLGKQEQKENVVRVELSANIKPDINKLQRHFYTSSSCGVCGKSSIEAIEVNCTLPIKGNFLVEENVIHTSPEKLRTAQKVFEYTGGLHAAGLFDESGELLLMREDVGRHNALDKLIGACLVSENIPLFNNFVLLSGRVSFELIQKSVIAGIPLLAAVGAPSNLAVKLAKRFNMSLLGFVRDNRFNVYSGKDRIVLKQVNG